MRFWILTILQLKGKLEYFVDSIEKRIDDLSLDMKTDTFTLYDKILELSDKKIKVVNLSVMADNMLGSLSFEEQELIEAYLNGYSLEGLSGLTGICKSTLLRRINKIIKKCGNSLCKLGFCEKLLDREYRSFVPAAKLYDKIKREYLVRAEAGLSSKKKKSTLNNDLPVCSFESSGIYAKS